MIIGKYLPGHSIWHKLDPRSKLITVSLFVISCFLVGYWQALVALAGLELLGILATRLPLGYFLKSLRPILFFVFLTVGLQVLFNRQGEIIFEFGFFAITDEGIGNGLFMALRLIIVVLVSTILTLTTKPSDLTLALESLFSPLRAIKFPVAEMALMIAIALRFVPTLFEETQKILKSQASRGVDITEGKIRDKVSQLISLLVPLFVLSFKRAENLANAMEVRGYVPGMARSSINLLKWKGQDSILVIGAIAIFALSLWL
ncbi:MAG: energy-coupling factor transporter transmembrane protein EcfT [Turicibacter sp.]|nr:energy-coupling factor transporter transmembrane protein EcfT [Turicibacter sp.]